MLDVALILTLSYLAGSIPTSILAGRLLRGIDIRRHGSGNAGATNTFRVLGWKAGLAVAAIDVAKGFLAVLLIARIRISGGPGAAAVLIQPPSLLPVLAGCAAILGHIFPVFARFRGGKGVGTGAGAMFALHPAVAGCCLFVFVVTALLTGYVSLSSILASITLPVSYLVITALQGEPFDAAWIVFTWCVAAAIVYMHRKNIRRLFRGTESRFEKLRVFRRRLDGGRPEA